MGCRVRITAAGNIAFRIYWRGVDSQESTRKRATKRNLEACERIAARIDAQIKADRYTDEDYRTDFPFGSRRELLGRGRSVRRGSKVATDMTVEGYFAVWIDAVKATSRPTRILDYERRFRLYVKPHIGDLRLREMTLDDLRVWQKALLVDRRLAVNTAKTAIIGTFRPMWRDARRSLAKIVDLGDPFDGLRWPPARMELRIPIAAEDERIILDHFRTRNPRYYVFVAFMLGTGCRPSEATGLTWQHVDLRTGRVTIAQSRVRGYLSATKTAASTRTITLAPHLVALLRERQPLVVKPDDPVFRNKWGRPLEQQVFSDHAWPRALRVAGVRHYPLYATRHTYISKAISAGANPKHVAEYVGTSLAKIDRHYGRWMGGTDADPLTMAEGRVSDDSIVRHSRIGKL